jgi:hypothetical protein
MHYTRWKRHGDPLTVANYHRRTIKSNYVQLRCDDGSYKFEHVILAEKALGHPLPNGSLVHHMDRDGTNNNSKSPWNLVVCPNQKYHLLLHAKARALGYEPAGRLHKLTSAQRRAIRNSTESKEVLARLYNVTVSSIKEIRSARGRQKAIDRGFD